MARSLRAELRTSQPFRGPEDEAFLAIQRTADMLYSQLGVLLERHGLNQKGYNVLRILRGAGNHGLTAAEIAPRMVNVEPDLEPLLIRLRVGGLVDAGGYISPAELSWRITECGHALIDSLDEPVHALHVEQFRHLSEATLRLLIGLLNDVRDQSTNPVDGGS